MGILSGPVSQMSKCSRGCGEGRLKLGHASEPIFRCAFDPDCRAGANRWDVTDAHADGEGRAGAAAGLHRVFSQLKDAEVRTIRTRASRPRAAADAGASDR